MDDDIRVEKPATPQADTPASPHAERLAALEEWMVTHVHNSVVSAHESAVNRINRALAEIRAAIREVKE